MAVASKQSNQQQIVQAVFDEAEQALDVKIVSGGTTPSPIEINVDGVATIVARDTVTPANNVPVPTVVLNPATGVPVNPASESTQVSNNTVLSTIATNTSNTFAAIETGRVPSGLFNIDYTGTPVTSGAYVELIPAATLGATNYIHNFDSSGQTLIVAYGAVGSEVDKWYISPGGNGIMQIYIPPGVRVSVKALNVTADVGVLLLSTFI